MNARIGNIRLIALLGLLATVSLAPIGGATAAMSPETRLTTIAGSATSTEITAYQGQLYITWAEGTAPGTFDIWTIRSLNNGDSWQTPVMVATNVAVSNPIPRIAAGGTGVYVFWTDNYQHNSSGTGIYYARSTDNGASFAAPQLLVAKSGVGYTRPSSALVDASASPERVYIAWYDSRLAGGAEIGQAFVAMSCDGGANFSAPQQVTTLDRGNDAEAPRLALSADASTLYINYRSSLDGLPQEGWAPFSQRLIRSRSISCSPGPSISWQQPSARINPGLPARHGNTYGALLTRGTSDNFHLAYWGEDEGNDLIYQNGKPLSTGWTDPLKISSGVSGFGPNHLEYRGEVAEGGAFGLGEDADGNVHFAFWNANSAQVDGFAVGKVIYRMGTPSGSSLSLGSPENIVASEVAFDPRAVWSNDRLAVVWADFRDNGSGAGGSEIYYRHVFSNLTGKQIAVAPTTVNLGTQLANTTGTPAVVGVSVIGDTSVTISGVSTTGQFGATTNCGTQAVGSNCQVNVTFTPTSTGTKAGSLTINSDAQNAPHTVTLSGVGDSSVVDHYFRSILDREPDSGGKAFWEGEVSRMAALGVDAKEVFIVMANFFFKSPEYLSKNTSDTTFLSNLYRTFFGRNADTAGEAFWQGQIDAGMPRDLVMFNFLFSNEFITFMQSIFGTGTSSPEILAVVDYYRGLLNRLPDDSGGAFWIQQFQTAQCQGAGAVYAAAESISSGFSTSAEYINRARNNTEYVSDLYNAFLRRGGDLSGVNFWIDQLNTAAKTREVERQDFIASPEFTNRINSIIAAAQCSGN